MKCERCDPCVNRRHEGGLRRSVTGPVARWGFLRLAIGVAAAGIAWGPATAEVSLTCREDRIDVAVDGEPFTAYVFTGHRKPILYPVHGPGGTPMTRSWPLDESVAGEAHDHPHHESLWFTHGLVNGVDFWTSHPGADKEDRQAANRIEHVALREARSGPEGVIEAVHRWVKADGTVVCTDTTRLVFGGDPRIRTIDYAVTIHADHGPVTFGDTKEGALGIRMRTPLQLRDLDGSAGAAGQCVNSEGVRGADIWGKSARWVDYWGPVDGRTMGIAILDHPGSFRHPTHWHARDYGLVAANPFGLHDFTGSPQGSGDHTIPAGGSLALRGLFVFHEGDAETAGIEAVWRRWAKAAAGENQPVDTAAP